MTPKRHDMVVTRWGARFLGRRFACAVGRGGIRPDKTEGDAATPAGTWCIVGVGYRPDRGVMPATSGLSGVSVAPILPRDIWSDDPRDPDYNHLLRSYNHPFSHEKLRRPDPLYDIVLSTDWNWPEAVPGHGSAIFIHQWRRPRYPTAGCIAFSRRDLRWILARWTRHSRIHVRA